MLLQPAVRFHNLIGIGSRREDLRNQRVRIQRDRRDELLQLSRGLWRGLNRWLCAGLVRLGERSRQSG